MTTRVMRLEDDRTSFKTLVDSYKLPCTGTVVKGEHRSVEQNKLQRLWLNEAEEQLGEYTAEEYRAYCKLHFGVPILRAEDEHFCEEYDDKIKDRYTYEEKLEMMIGPKIELPVTRLMTTRQKTTYLDAMHHHFTTLGVKLTDPGGGL